MWFLKTPLPSIKMKTQQQIKITMQAPYGQEGIDEINGSKSGGCSIYLWD